MYYFPPAIDLSTIQQNETLWNYYMRIMKTDDCNCICGASCCIDIFLCMYMLKFLNVKRVKHRGPPDGVTQQQPLAGNRITF